MIPNLKKPLRALLVLPLLLPILSQAGSFNWRESPAWIGPTLGMSEVTGHTAMITGLRLALQPKPQWGLGVWGASVAGNVTHRYDTLPQAVEYDAFGLLAETRFASSHPLHLVFPMLLGMGSVNVTTPENEDTQSAGWFVTLESQMHLEYEFSESFHASIGGGLRVFKGLDGNGRTDLRSEDFNTWVAEIMLRWGRFGSKIQGNGPSEDAADYDKVNMYE